MLGFWRMRRELGIKTVSGLTFYAIMNGIISGDDIEL